METTGHVTDRLTNTALTLSHEYDRRTNKTKSLKSREEGELKSKYLMMTKAK